MHTIFIENLIVEGFHGIDAEERSQKQPFRVDVRVSTFYRRPTDPDNISFCIDYRPFKKIIERVVGEESHSLIEVLAERIAMSIRQVDSRVASAEVTVRKLALWDSGIPGVTIQL